MRKQVTLATANSDVMNDLVPPTAASPDSMRKTPAASMPTERMATMRRIHVSGRLSWNARSAFATSHVLRRLIAAPRPVRHRA
jgi:hypothetical protein